MNMIKIAISLKKKFSEFYDIKQYKVQASEQFVVRHYTANNQKVTINKEK
ncbi:MAG: hypothetical protein AABX78_03165 [Nanoarchaeota archaeon]